MRASAVGRYRNGDGIARQQGDAVGLDERVEDKGAAGLALAIAAVAAMDEHRRRSEPVTQRSAGAAAFERVFHPILQTDHGAVDCAPRR